MPKQTVNPVLDEQWFRWASFSVAHRDQLKRLAIGLVVVAEAALLIYSGYGWLDYLVLSRDRDAVMLAELTQGTDVRPLHQAMAPSPISIAAATVLPGSSRGGGNDVLAKFINANERWAATVTYHFEGGAVSGADDHQVVLLSDEERFVIGPGVATGAATPTVVVTNVRWQRIRDLERFAALKPKFSVEAVSFRSASELALGGESSGVSQVSFVATNQSVASFWTVGFTIVLLQGDRPLAARYLTLERVRSGETRQVSLNLYTSITSVTSVLVVPDVNILDPTVFMPAPEGSIQF